MTDQPTSSAEKNPKRSQRDRRVKLVFLVVAGIIIAVAWWSQTRGSKLTGWGRDLPAGLKQARTEGRPVLLFFLARKQNEATRRMIDLAFKDTLVLNPIREGKCVAVAVEVDRELKSDLAKQYEIKELPSLLVLSSTGAVLERKGGYVGAADISKMLRRAGAATD